MSVKEKRIICFEFFVGGLKSTRKKDLTKEKKNSRFDLNLEISLT